MAFPEREGRFAWVWVRAEMDLRYNECNNGRRVMLALKLTQIGNSVGFVLPKEAAARLKVEKGDVVFLTESPEGYRLSPFDPKFAAQMQVAEGIMKKRRNALRELAK